MSTLSIVTALSGANVALIVGLNAMRIGLALNVLDHPDGGRKIHARATPLVGGLAVAVAVIFAAVVTSMIASDLRIAGLGAAVFSMFLIGAIDDRNHLSPVLRLGVALSIMGVLIAVMPDFGVHELRFAGLSAAWLLPGLGGICFTLVCLVGLLNAINMADGKNGIVIGFGLIWTVVLAVHAPPFLMPVLAAAGAALAVTLVFNLRGKLFLGDGGSYAISALFGLTAIFVYNAGGRMNADDVALLFAIPVFDTIRLMAVRLADGRSPLEGDRDHLHHHFYTSIGWPLGLWAYLALVAVPNLAALVWPGSGLAWLVVSLFAYGIVLFATRFVSEASRPAE